ncbi:MAG: hypothetical protein A2252_05875 [Elusimicrobia bacterium RIFOXYA2_FULL_39_19]|nr:MAG: hypothetical protein A2252_05875 [Elusimicrobia bacterium RIFOXYA2_FULL_39_19]
MRPNDLNKIRDCVREAIKNGSKRGSEFLKMKHAIIAELKLLHYPAQEIKDELLIWNKKCDKPLGPAEEYRQLIKYVDWAFKEAKIGCKSLRNYCIGEEDCQFHKRKFHPSTPVPPLPFDINDLDSFLTIRYGAKGVTMLYIVKALRNIQITKNTGDIIYIGYRGLVSIIRDLYRCRFVPQDIFRHIRLLEDEGVLEKTYKGKAGSFSMKANGYTFLPWTSAVYHINSGHERLGLPTVSHKPIITQLCNSFGDTLLCNNISGTYRFQTKSKITGDKT